MLFFKDLLLLWTIFSCYFNSLIESVPFVPMHKSSSIKAFNNSHFSESLLQHHNLTNSTDNLQENMLNNSVQNTKLIDFFSDWNRHILYLDQFLLIFNFLIAIEKQRMNH